MDIFSSPEWPPISQEKSEEGVNIPFENEGLKVPDAVVHHGRKIGGNAEHSTQFGCENKWTLEDKMC